MFGYDFRKGQGIILRSLGAEIAAAAPDRLGFHLAQAVGVALQWSWPQVHVVVSADGPEKQ